MVWKSTDNDYLKNHADTNYHHQPATLSIYSLKGKASEDASSSGKQMSLIFTLEIYFLSRSKLIRAECLFCIRATYHISNIT
jgi:hypothetical protein